MSDPLTRGVGVPVDKIGELERRVAALEREKRDLEMRVAAVEKAWADFAASVKQTEKMLEEDQNLR
jgi:hypothetical protein